MGSDLKGGSKSVCDGNGGKVGQVEEDGESDRALNNGDGALCQDHAELNVPVESTGVGVEEADGTLGDVDGFGNNVGGCAGEGEVDWMASSSGEVQEKEDEALGMADDWEEDDSASSRSV